MSIRVGLHEKIKDVGNGNKLFERTELYARIPKHLVSRHLSPWVKQHAAAQHTMKM